MMYLIPHSSRAHTRTVLAHEYGACGDGPAETLLAPAGGQTSNDEVDGSTGDGPSGQGCGTASNNIDYRVRYPDVSERYQLSVDDYHAMTRSHGNRGSTYLFLRCCADRYGPDLPGDSTAESTTATLPRSHRLTFAGLYRRWSLALYQSGFDPDLEKPDAAGDGLLTAFARRTTSGNWRPSADSLIARRSRRPLVGLLGTSSHFCTVDGASTAA